ncbi:MAG: hypothetical protein B6A08_07445 [Sorangiineae bacterium NIC37A_2]|jgi:signal transduction histidine kinase|nr:MAG: hypothetical protein B6A08_07445 [Sorangiineae bacterium NIC37A_2]
MSIDEGPTALAWMSVYAGLAGFYFLAARRISGRGYAYLGGMMSCFALSALSFWIARRSNDYGTDLALGRLIVLSGALAPPFHSRFMIEFLRFPPMPRVISASFLCAAAIIVCDLGVAASSWSWAVHGGARPFVVTAPELGVTMAGLVVLHLVFAATLLYRAIREGKRAARVLLFLVVCVGPAVVVDYGLTLSTGHGLPVIEVALWVYGLVVALVLLSELRGAEGLLEQTTSSLAERTAELEVSYAELEQVQTELDEKERLAAVGELAGAIAHEVRNPLAVIMNAASGLRRPLAQEDTQSLLAIIEEEAHRLNHLVEDLLRFARPFVLARGPVLIEELFRQIAQDIEPIYEVSIEIEPGERTRSVWVDGSLLKFAIESVVDNALLSMPRGGPLSLRLRRGPTSSDPDGLRLEIEDKGSGMSPAILEKAKKPFFSTRPRGSGLGLPIVERIVREHGGELLIESKVGSGTLVSLCFPMEVLGEGPVSSTRGVPSSLRRRARARAGQRVDSSRGETLAAFEPREDQ